MYNNGRIPVCSSRHLWSKKETSRCAKFLRRYRVISGLSPLVLALITILSTSPAAAQTLDRDALVAIYNAADGDKWTDNTNWLTGDYCTWYGVTCENDRVIELSLTNNQLNGTIPGDLEELSKLKVLNLESNQLNGTIPPEIGKLTNLTALFLADNELNGSIPQTLGNLSNLTQLWLDKNQLTGEIPIQLGNLRNLDALALFENQLTGPLTDRLGSLTSLTLLLLNDNQLSGEIPTELGNLPLLDFVQLANNQLSGPIPPELWFTPSIQTLVLNNNELTGPIPSGFRAGSPFLIIDLGDNQLSGAIPVDIGVKLLQLQFLDLRGNRLSGMVPTTFTNLFNLSSLVLNDNSPDLCTPQELQSLVNSLGVYIPPPGGFCETEPSNLDVIEIEAESGKLNGGFVIGYDDEASEGAYVYAPDDVGNRGVELDKSQSIHFSFSVEQDGIYRFRGVVNTPDVFSNSFYASVDDFPSQGYTWHNQVAGGYVTEYVTDGPLIDMVERKLTAGEHTLTIYLRETNTRLDKIIVERVADALIEPMPEGCDGLVREAEAGEWEGMFTVGEDKNASGGFYVHVPDGLGSRGDFPDTAQKASYCFTVEQPGTYRVKAWVYADNKFNNSFFVSVNDDVISGAGGELWQDRIWHTHVNTDYMPAYVTTNDVVDGQRVFPHVEVELDAGVHTVYFLLREDGTRLDKVALESVNMVPFRALGQATIWPDGASTFLPFLSQ